MGRARLGRDRAQHRESTTNSWSSARKGLIAQRSRVAAKLNAPLSREDTEGKSILFPIRIDDYIFDKWDHERKTDVLRKVVGDFSGWETDAAMYDKALNKLLNGLQAKSGKR